MMPASSASRVIDAGAKAPPETVEIRRQEVSPVLTGHGGADPTDHPMPRFHIS
jgi:hypothetical protein